MERKSKEAYCRRLEIRSDKSVTGIHFHPDTDIDWDNPEYAFRKNDERWILGDWDNLGAHPWYKEQSKEEKIRIGMFRIARTMLAGSQFEELLISGLMHMKLEMGVSNPLGRYLLHESGDEINHIMMFEEFVKRSGVKAQGIPTWFRRTAPWLTPISTKSSVGFMNFVLAGEEPVDHTQQTMIRLQEAEEIELPPLVHKIMDIHVKEEARHISTAQDFLKETVPDLSPTHKKLLGRVGPKIFRLAANMIMVPTEDIGIDPKVMKEVWWDSEYSQKFLPDLFPGARKLYRDLGLLDQRDPDTGELTFEGRATQRAWKRAGIYDADERPQAA